MPDVLDKLNEYESIAQVLGEIVVDQKNTEIEEWSKIVRLQNIINKLKEEEERGIDKIRLENNEISRRTSNFLLAIIITLFIFSMALSIGVSRSISKPIQELTKASRELKKGNLNYKVDIKSKDEIGELAGTFNQMRLKLKQREELAVKDRNELLNSLLNTFKGKFGNIVTILVRKNIQELVKKNPRIKKILPKSLSKSITESKETGLLKEK